MPPKRRTKRDAGLLAGSDRTDAHFAATAGRSDLLEEAMEQNIDLSHADKDGMTALHCACARSARGAPGVGPAGHRRSHTRLIV